MAQFALTCSSTTDLPASFFDQHKIGLGYFHFMLNDHEYADDLGKTLSSAQFYQAMRDGATTQTSQVSMGDYIDLFTTYLMRGEDILHIELSSGLSGSYNAACLAAEQLLQQYPDRQIRVVDSLGASSGYGMLIRYAVDLRDANKSLSETYEWVEANKLHVHHWFYSTDLTWYYRGGRISRTSMAVGTMLHICPLLNMNDEGKLIPREKYRGRKRVIEEIVHKMELHAQDGLNYRGRCYLSHSDILEDAQLVKQMVEERFPNLQEPVMINNIGTVIGSHTGPGTLALYFLGDKRTR